MLHRPEALERELAELTVGVGDVEVHVDPRLGGYVVAVPDRLVVREETPAGDWHVEYRLLEYQAEFTAPADRTAASA